MGKTVFESLRMSDLIQYQCGILRVSSSTRPALRIIKKNGVRAIVKDYSENRFLYRNIMGRFLIWRERKAYRKLSGLKGIPAFLGVIEGTALVTEEIPGRSLEGLEKKEALPEAFFKELRTLVDNFHNRGVAHCDLKRAPNILMGEDSRPYIVDWSAAILEKEFRFFPLNRIYRKFIKDDLNGVTKIQIRHCPDSIKPEDKKRYYYRSKPETVIRALRDKLRYLLQRIA